MISLNQKNFILLFLLINFCICERALIFVYEHVRHGARGPSSGYKAILNNGVDEYGIKWGTDGELTQIGKRQHYYLGVRNRLKYSNLINFKEYNPKEILIHSTDYNRTHQSVLSELYGMYEGLREAELKDDEPKFTMVNDKYMKDNNTNLFAQIHDELSNIGNKVNSESFPVFNIHKFPDKRIFLVDDCIKLNNYRDEKNGPQVKKFFDEFDSKFLKAFKKIMNKNEDFFHLYDTMKSYTDHFICAYDNKKDLSHLEKEELDLDAFYNFSKRFYGHFIFNYFVDEYTSGLEETHLMQDVIGYMIRRINNLNEVTYKAPKMVIDSGHDSTVGPMARFLSSALKVKYHEFCEFACNIYLELYKEDDGKYTVDYYLDDELIFKEKEFYKEFKEPIESHYWNDTYMDEFCGKKEDSDIDNSSKLSDYSNILFAISIVSSILFLIFITSTIVIFRRLKKLQKKLQENPLLNEETEGAELPALT